MSRSSQQVARTPVQALVHHLRVTAGPSIVRASAVSGTSRSALQRAEHGGHAVLESLASAAEMDLGAWPAPADEHVDEVLAWWRLHPVERLRTFFEANSADARAAYWGLRLDLRHRRAVLIGDGALLTVLPAGLLPSAVRREPVWQLACLPGTEPGLDEHRALGTIDVREPEGWVLPPGFVRRAIAVRDDYGQRCDGLRVAHPRDLMVTVGWSPGLAAAVRAVDLVGPAVLGGAGSRRADPRPRAGELRDEDYDEDLGTDDVDQPAPPTDPALDAALNPALDPARRRAALVELAGQRRGLPATAQVLREPARRPG